MPASTFSCFQVVKKIYTEGFNALKMQHATNKRKLYRATLSWYFTVFGSQQHITTVTTLKPLSVSLLWCVLGDIFFSRTETSRASDIFSVYLTWQCSILISSQVSKAGTAELISAKENPNRWKHFELATQFYGDWLVKRFTDTNVLLIFPVMNYIENPSRITWITTSNQTLRWMFQWMHLHERLPWLLSSRAFSSFSILPPSLVTRWFVWRFTETFPFVRLQTTSCCRWPSPICLWLF